MDDAPPLPPTPTPADPAATRVTSGSEGDPVLAPLLLESARLGKYELIEVLGQGAMGTVYLAHDTVLEREVAVKLMTSRTAADPDMGERFVREARAAARLTHKNVVQVFELGSDEQGTPFIAMERLKGEDLLETLRQGRPLTLERRLDIVVQVLAGLGQAHAAGIVHRDVKPANIFLCHDGVAKIMDFGVARLTDAAATSTGLVVGTAAYMSPEQVKAATVDGRSDLFSVGAVLFELLTHHRPFHRDDIVAIFYAIANEEPDYDLVPAGSEYDALIPVLKKALAKDPAARHPTAEAFAAELQQCLEATRREGSAPAPDERRRHKRMRVDLPVKVEGWSPDGMPWTELATTEDASPGGGGFRLAHAVRPGQALRLNLSLPRQFRQYDYDEVAYTIWALVRSVREGRVGVLFLGREPPSGWSTAKGGSFTLPADLLAGNRQHPRFELALNLRLLRPAGPAGRREEWTVSENIGVGGALVRTTLRIRRGETVELEEVGGDFHARGEVQSVSAGADGITRLNVRFDAEGAAERVREVLKRNGIVLDGGPEPAPQGKRTPILVLEADPALARSIRRMLERSREPGWRVDHVTSASAAVARLQQPGVEAILMDLDVEDSRGLDTLERVHAAAPALPVVVLVGAEDEDAGIDSLRRGAQDYVVRTQLDEAMLVRFLRTSIERKKASLVVAPAPGRPTVRTGQPLEQGAFAGILREHYAARRTGLFTVVKGDAARRLRLREGSIVAGSSGVPGERLGDVLVRLGLLSAADSARATEAALRDGQRLGVVLKELGLLTEERLQEGMAAHVREVFAAIASLQGASWSFRDEEVPEHEDVTLRVPTGEILLESVRRMEDPALVSRQLGDLDRPLARSSDPILGFQRVALSSTEGYVLSRVDGVLTARQVLEVVPLTAEEGERILLSLLAAGLVEWTVAAPRPRRAAPAAAPAPAGQAGPPAVADPVRPPAVRRQEILEAWDRLDDKDYFEVLGLSRTATPAEVQAAWERMASAFHPDTHHDPALADLKDRIVAVFMRVGEAYEVLRDPDRRRAHELELSGRDYQRQAASRRASPAQRAAAPVPPDPVLLLKKAQAFLAAERVGDAVHLLEEAVPLTRGRMKTRARILLAQAYMKNPSWRREAQGVLEKALQDDPDHVETCLLLGALFAGAGLKARAANLYRRALERQPGATEIAAALAALDQA